VFKDARVQSHFGQQKLDFRIRTARGDIMKIVLTLACVLSLSACGVQQTLQDTSKQTREGYCPDCAWANSARGTTWTVLGQQDNPRGEDIVVVGADAQTNSIQGDTPLEVDLPILCLQPLVTPSRFITPDQTNPTINARVALSGTKPGLQARSLSASDETCQQQFGDGWRMAHDTDSPNLTILVGYGQIEPDIRFWVAIDRKP
jgi:hypothetical protein